MRCSGTRAGNELTWIESSIGRLVFSRLWAFVEKCLCISVVEEVSMDMATSQ